MERQVENITRSTPAPQGRTYLCGCCKRAFQVPLGATVPFRYVGRSPEVQCPECQVAELFSAPK